MGGGAAAVAKAVNAAQSAIAGKVGDGDNGTAGAGQEGDANVAAAVDTTPAAATTAAAAAKADPSKLPGAVVPPLVGAADTKATAEAASGRSSVRCQHS